MFLVFFIIIIKEDNTAVLSRRIESSLQHTQTAAPSEMKRTTGRRGLTTFPILFLLVLFVTDVDSFSAQVPPSPGVALTNPSRDISKSILEGLRSSSPPTLTAKLDLETDFYDASTGLCSEGVWHNCLVGIASLELGQHDEASQIAKSLWKYSFDGTSFQR
jgi:hypothetical protein